MICGETKARKKKAKRLQGARKLRKDEEMSWAPPRNMSNWPDLEEARSMEESGWRLEPEGEAEIIIVSNAVRGTKVDVDGKGFQVKQMEKMPRTWS